MKDVLNGCFFVKMSTQKKGKNDAEVGGFFLERRDFSGLELVAPALGIIHGLKPLFSSRPLMVGENSSEGSFTLESGIDVVQGITIGPGKFVKKKINIGP